MALKRYDFNLGPQGVAVTTANAGLDTVSSPGGGSVVYDSGSAIDGQFGILCTSVANQQSLVRSLANAAHNSMSGRFGFKVPSSGPGSELRIFTIRHASGTCGRFTLDSSRTLRFRNTTDASPLTVATGLTAGNKYEVSWWVIVGGGGTNVSINYYNAGSDTPINGSPITATAYALGSSAVVGGDAGVAGVIGTASTISIDNIQWSDGVTTHLSNGFTASTVLENFPATTVDALTPVTLTAAVASGGAPDSYTWAQVSGPTVTLTGSGATRTFTAPADVAGATVVIGVTPVNGGVSGAQVTATLTVKPQSLWLRDAGAWKALSLQNVGGGSAPPPPPSDRESLVYGTYEPSLTTAGVPAGTVLTTISSNASLPTSTGAVSPTATSIWRITTANTIIQDLDIYGTIDIRATGVIVRRCKLRGLANPQVGVFTPLINCSNMPSGTPARVQDCDLTATVSVPGVEGVRGKNFEAFRNRISNVVDGFHVWNGNVWIKGNLGESLAWHPNDPFQGPEGTHNDWVQFQGGSGANCHVIGNSFNSGYSPYGSSNLGMLVTKDQGVGAGYFIEGNYWRTKLNGNRVAIPINLAITEITNFTCRNNRIQLGRDGYHIIARSAIRAQVQNEPGNVDLDTGAAIIVQNGG